MSRLDCGLDELGLAVSMWNAYRAAGNGTGGLWTFPEWDKASVEELQEPWLAAVKGWRAALKTLADDSPFREAAALLYAMLHGPEPEKLAQFRQNLMAVLPMEAAARHGVWLLDCEADELGSLAAAEERWSAWAGDKVNKELAKP